MQPEHFFVPIVSRLQYKLWYVRRCTRFIIIGLWQPLCSVELAISDIDLVLVFPAFCTKGAFTNYVGKVLFSIDHLPTHCWHRQGNSFICYKRKYANHWHFQYLKPTYLIFVNVVKERPPRGVPIYSHCYWSWSPILPFQFARRQPDQLR